MIFALHGVNFENKGAELMLYAAKQKLHEWNPNNVVACHLLIGDFEKRKNAEVNHLAWRPINKYPLLEKVISPTVRLVPKNIRKKYSITLESEVEVILDASGFAYSDQWGPMASEKMAKLYVSWKKQNKKIILLPQAFGPFNNKRVKDAFIEIMKNTDLIFARDQISYNYINQLSEPMKNVKIAPDFTNLVEGVEPSYINNIARRPCIVPNQRMIDKTDSEIGTKYVELLMFSIEYLYKQGLEPFILIHEEKDAELGFQLQSMLTQPIPVIQESNSLCLKAILGKAHFVIGSRFHSLVSALSQGVPCLGTGWSHKYKALFQDYGCLDLLLNTETSDHQDMRNLIDLLVDETSCQSVVEVIQREGLRQKLLANNMWIEVKKELDK